jgi:hypothetical protein
VPLSRRKNRILSVGPNMKQQLGIYPIFCLLACGLAALLINAAPLPVRSFQKDASGVTIKLKSGVLRLEVCDDPSDRRSLCAGFSMVAYLKFNLL